MADWLIKMKRGIRISFMILALALAFSNATAANAAEDLYIPARAVRSGNYLFYSAGMDKSGLLVRYQLKTGKKKTLCKGGARDISVKGKYVYFSMDAQKGDNSFVTKKGIYRIKKNGGKKKKLANGVRPIIIGDYIYYLGIKATGMREPNQEICGIYRMNLNGSKKECLLASSRLANWLLAGENKLLFIEYNQDMNEELKWLDLTDGSISPYEQESDKLYANTTDYYTTTCGLNLQIGNSQKGYTYTYSGKKLYRVSGKKKKITTFSKGNIETVVDLNGYLYVEVHPNMAHPNSDYMYVYVMKANGKQKRCLTKFSVAGGSWN